MQRPQKRQNEIQKNAPLRSNSTLVKTLLKMKDACVNSVLNWQWRHDDLMGELSVSTAPELKA